LEEKNNKIILGFVPQKKIAEWMDARLKRRKDAEQTKIGIENQGANEPAPTLPLGQR